MFSGVGGFKVMVGIICIINFLKDKDIRKLMTSGFAPISRVNHLNNCLSSALLLIMQIKHLRAAVDQGQSNGIGGLIPAPP